MLGKSDKKILIDKKAIRGAKVAIIRARYNGEFTKKLETACVEMLVENGVFRKQIFLTSVPGALEIPIAAQRVAISKKADVIIALGVILKGGTYHFELVSGECARGCMDVALKYNIPVIFEVISAYNLAQVKKRTSGVNNKGREAAFSALEVLTTLSKIR